MCHPYEQENVPVDETWHIMAPSSTCLFVLILLVYFFFFLCPFVLFVSLTVPYCSSGSSKG